MIRAISVSVSAIAVLAFSGPAVAQGVGSYYAGGAFMLSWQDAGTPAASASHEKPGVGGSAVGINGTVGAILSPRVSIAAEISEPARFESVQELQYSFSQKIDNRHRDLIVSVLAHLHELHPGMLRPELVVGASYVHEDTLRRTAQQIGPPFPPTGVYGPYGPEGQITHDSLGVTGGADLGVRVSAHVSIVPQVRLHWIFRASPSGGNSSAHMALGPLAIRPAIGLRATF